jgi:peptidoglycan-associated lipoprotein
MLIAKQWLHGALAAALILGTVACKKAPKPSGAGAAPVTDRSAAKPTVSFTAEPGNIQPGQSATLRWNVKDASVVSVDPGIGSVSDVGSRAVSPRATTSYTLTANGPGGTTTANVTVRLTSATSGPPGPPSAPTASGKLSFGDRISRILSDVYFDYDSAEIRGDSRTALEKNAGFLKDIFNDFPTGTVSVDGHADERGSAEYNLGLSDRRASATKEFLVQLGVPESRLKVVGYGKERPFCPENTEECHGKNRRAHFAAIE